jgi:uncharacterized protein (TIGR02271 family)
MTNLTGAQTPAAAGNVSNQVVAMFDTYDHARAARDALISAGIERSRIELLGRSVAEEDTSFRYERNEGGFWAAVKNMFMPDDESHLYAEGINRGHTMLVVRGPTGEQDRIISLLESQNPLDVETHAAQWRQSGWSGMYAGQAGSQTRQASSGLATSGTAGQGREEVIPVYQEQLRVGKREVDRGSVRVRSYVVETPVQEQVHLHEERVEVERRPVDRPMTTADAGAGAFKDRTIEVTATAEEAVVGKETRVKEEVVVRKEEEERTQTVRDTVRNTEVEVEHDRASGTRAPTPGVTPTRRP